jgi:hypothetical protein
VDAEGQDIWVVGELSSPNCTNAIYAADERTDRGKERLEIGEAVTNTCLAYLVKEGALTQVGYTVADPDQSITWK